MLYLTDIWMIACGVAGVLIAMYEARQSSPRMIAMLTAAWLVVLCGVSVVAFSVRYNSRVVEAIQTEQERVQQQLEETNLIVQEQIAQRDEGVR